MISSYWLMRIGAKQIQQLGLVICLVFTFIPMVQAEKLTLSWDKNDPSVVTYRLFQRTSQNSYDYSKWVYEGPDTSCVIDNLVPNTTYHFVIRACSEVAESPNSNELSITIPAEPDDITVTETEVIIDNRDDENTSTGNWRVSKAKNPYGSNSLFSRSKGGTFAFESDLTGDIDVSLWWTQWRSRSISAPVMIYDGDQLLDTVYVDQTRDGGQWNLLDTYTFHQSARIVVVSEDRTSSTCADAVRLLRTE